MTVEKFPQKHVLDRVLNIEIGNPDSDTVPTVLRCSTIPAGPQTPQNM